MDQSMLYDILYALVVRNGREAVLFGSGASRAREAFVHSKACAAFPELWFELPLNGDPWFDFHALTSHEDLASDMSFAPEQTGGYPEVFEWFAAEGDEVRQLALSWDVGSSNVDACDEGGLSGAQGDLSVRAANASLKLDPAVQLLLRRPSLRAMEGFLEAVGRADAAPAYRTFVQRQPEQWFACYTGVFPSRPDFNLRVECIPTTELQQAYAADAGLLESHLRGMGLTEFGDTLIPRCQMAASTPFQLEFQFDVDAAGSARPTFSASLRFACPPGTEDYPSFVSGGAADALMSQLERWGLSDDRWRLLADTAFASRVAREGESVTLYCYPAFIKLRWRGGEPVDAKTYLIAGVNRSESGTSGGSDE